MKDRRGWYGAHVKKKKERNEALYREYEEIKRVKGRFEILAKRFAISPQRVSQLIKKYEERKMINDGRI